MPTIPLIRNQKKTPSERKKERQSLYGRKDYRRKVDWYKREHIWCCECLKDGIYTPGTELHHIQSPFQGDLTKEQQLKLLYDQNNWKLLCDFHHRLQHGTVSKQEIEDYNKKVKKVDEGLV